MQNHLNVDSSLRTLRLIDLNNCLTSDLPIGFGDDPNRTRYLCWDVMNQDWAQNLTAHMGIPKQSFVLFINASQENLQLEDES